MVRVIIILLILIFFVIPNRVYGNEHDLRWWEIQSVDTMKTSRDQAREMVNSSESNNKIETEVIKVASVGATHIAVGTPYDEEFIPYLEKWVDTARGYGLNVWFRGNFSGWEGWFDYQTITEVEHQQLLRDFISSNPGLFEDGDIFTPCPECENGSIGDPRETGQIENFQQFLIEEYDICNEEMEKLKKNVRCGYFSMNGDVAKLVMDQNTINNTGGLVVIDHYTKTTDELVLFIEEFYRNTNSEVVLGEIGAPIPDIHGEMNEESQSEWISDALSDLSQKDYVKGINYWVSTGGSTALWNDNGAPKEAVNSLQQYFLPEILNCKIENKYNVPLKDVKLRYKSREYETNENGLTKIPYDPLIKKMFVSRVRYKPMSVSIENCKNNIVLEREEGLTNWIYYVIEVLMNL